MLRTGTSKIFSPVCVVATLVLLAGMAFGQTLTDDTYFVNYYSNAHNSAGTDARVRIDNPGVDNAATLCADIYVFDNSEQMLECCGCTVTADDLRALSINSNLTANTVNKEVPTSGVIKIVSALENPNGKAVCDPTGGDTLTNPTKNDIVVQPDIRAWAVHLQEPFTGSSSIVSTEEEFADSTLTQNELNNLQSTCEFGVLLPGSGKGVCTCGTGK
jgi:hypothetical protein